MEFISKSLIFSIVLFVFNLQCIKSECEPPKKIVEFQWHPKEAKEGGYFTPLAMQNDTNLVKEMLQGSSLNPDQDLKKICIRVRYSDEGKDASIVGYHNMTSQFKCSTVGNGKEWSFDCQHQSGKEEFSHRMYVTLTDNKTFAFVIRCWKSGLRGWTVFSTRKELHEDSHFHILEHAKSQGFETAYALPLSYKSCNK
ncbi:unnamed protein product [Orchesella dallaii]|uniref:Uncharacterized protein n=2 Tax=Orchesella dallaii TaxID=48710 RepID=A0ABP1PLF0_9HEXA